MQYSKLTQAIDIFYNQVKKTAQQNESSDRIPLITFQKFIQPQMQKKLIELQQKNNINGTREYYVGMDYNIVPNISRPNEWSVEGSSLNLWALRDMPSESSENPKILFDDLAKVLLKNLVIALNIWNSKDLSTKNVNKVAIEKTTNEFTTLQITTTPKEEITEEAIE